MKIILSILILTLIQTTAKAKEKTFYIHTNSNIIDLEIIQDSEVDMKSSSQILDHKISLKSKFLFDIDGNDIYEIIPENIMEFEGYTSIDGYYKRLGKNTDYYALFTVSEHGVIGQFNLPNKRYKSKIIDEENIFEKITSEFGDEYTLEFDQDTSYGKTPMIEPNSIEGSIVNSSVTLDIGVIISSNTMGSYINAKSEVLNAINRGDAQLGRNGININLNPLFFAKVLNSIDSGLNSSDLIHPINVLQTQQLDIIDFDTVEPANLLGKVKRVHHIVLAVGGSSSSTACGRANAEGTFSSFTVTKFGNNCSEETLVHEIGHNLSLVHEDGVIRNDISPKNCNENKTTWHSIMSAHGSNKAIYFTGGKNNSEISNCKCDGVCNVECNTNGCTIEQDDQRDEHDSRQILIDNKIWAVQNNYENVYFGGSPDPDAYENDDSFEQSTQLPINGPYQAHNLNGGDLNDWFKLQGKDVPNSNNCLSYKLCSLKFQNIVSENICVEEVNYVNIVGRGRTSCGSSLNSFSFSVPNPSVSFEGGVCHYEFPQTDSYFLVNKKLRLQSNSNDKNYQIKLECAQSSPNNNY